MKRHLPQPMSLDRSSRINRRSVPRLLALIGALQIACLTFAAAPPGEACRPMHRATPADLERFQAFRDSVIGYVRAAAATPATEKRPAFKDPKLDLAGQWSTRVRAYRDGELKGSGRAGGRHLSEALYGATQAALHARSAGAPEHGVLERTRFLVTFFYPPKREASIIGYHGKGFEWIGDTVPVAHLDEDMIKRHLQHAKAYLLRIMDPDHHGFAKSYDADRDATENRLRTVYTASSLYTLLKLDARKQDPAIERIITPVADFILSMQCTRPPCQGGFYYSYDTSTHSREQRVVTGTASKTIFTLLNLWRKTGNDRYRRAAVMAGDWLIAMQNPDGGINSALVRKDGKWIEDRRFSLLYNGQALSALARLAAATHSRRHRQAAGRIADLFMDKIKKAGYMLGDRYRTPNSVSTSWVARSLMDYSLLDSDPRYRRAVYRLSDAILKRQADDPFDPYTYGSFYDDPSSSGTGWINEVLVDIYGLCRTDGRDDCGKYKEAIVNDSRWLLQRTYNPVNSFALKNPAHADGGAIRNYMVKAVRTDAVCHGTNSLLGLLDVAGGDIHLTLPKRPFFQYLEQIRRGPPQGGPSNSVPEQRLGRDQAPPAAGTVPG